MHEPAGRTVVSVMDTRSGNSALLDPSFSHSPPPSPRTGEDVPKREGADREGKEIPTFQVSVDAPHPQYLAELAAAREAERDEALQRLHQLVAAAAAEVRWWHELPACSRCYGRVTHGSHCVCGGGGLGSLKHMRQPCSRQMKPRLGWRRRSQTCARFVTCAVLWDGCVSHS